MRTALRRCVRTGAAVVMVTAAVSVWQVVPGKTAARAAADGWVAAAGGADLSLAELNRYPASYQDAFYAAMAPAQKLAIWRAHLAQAAASPRLTPLKRDVLARVAAGLRAEDFDPDAARSPGMRHLLEEAEVVLGSQVALLRSSAWRKVTVAESMSLAALPGMLRLVPLHVAERLLQPAVAGAQTAPYCNCWVPEEGTYDCAYRAGFHKYCAPSAGGNVCQQIGSYNGPCGLFDDRPCDGLCAYIGIGGGGGPGGGGGSGGGCCGYEGNYCDAGCQCCQAV